VPWADELLIGDFALVPLTKIRAWPGSPAKRSGTEPGSRADLRVCRDIGCPEAVRTIHSGDPATKN